MTKPTNTKGQSEFEAKLMGLVEQWEGAYPQIPDPKVTVAAIIDAFVESLPKIKTAEKVDKLNAKDNVPNPQREWAYFNAVGANAYRDMILEQLGRLE